MTIDGKHNLSLVLFCKQVEASPALNVQYWAYLELGAVCSGFSTVLRLRARCRKSACKKAFVTRAKSY